MMTDFLNQNENGKFSVNEKYKLTEQKVILFMQHW